MNESLKFQYDSRHASLYACKHNVYMHVNMCVKKHMCYHAYRLPSEHVQK